MKTENENGSTETSVDKIRDAIAKLTALRQAMTVLVPLTPAERLNYRSARMAVVQLQTLMNRVAMARENRKLLPPAFDLRKLEADAGEAMVLGEFLAAIDELRAVVRDTLLPVSHRSQAATSTAFAHIKATSNLAERINPTAEKTLRRGSRSTVKGTEPAVVPKTAAPPDPSVSPTDKAA